MDKIMGFLICGFEVMILFNYFKTKGKNFLELDFVEKFDY